MRAVWRRGHTRSGARAGLVLKRTLVSFYDDQMTHHAAALTYYSLMSLFPAALLALSLLGLIGQYPETYDAIIGYLRDVVPASALAPLDSSLRAASRTRERRRPRLRPASLLTFYGTTGVLEAARRALNVVFELEGGRSFLRRKSIDIGSTVVLMALVLASVMLLPRRRVRRGCVRLHRPGSEPRRCLGRGSLARGPAVAMLVFAFIYYVTPDVEQRAFRWVTPGALAA